MNPTLSGIHHITAITADAQKNIDFYTGVLGLRLVKLTVNFDDPASYHLYYGDELGHPGTLLTFFAWNGAARGHIGPPQVSSIAFAVPAGALEYWAERLHEHNVPLLPAELRLGERILCFTDPDGLSLELAPMPDAPAPAAPGPVPSEYAICGFYNATLAEESTESTARFLTDILGFHLTATEDNRFRYSAAGDFASTIDLLRAPDARRGTMGAGVVHHIAFRTPDDAQQEAWRQQLTHLGYNVTPVMDRVYFHSIYFREPGGVLFEIATEPPGFTVDQSEQELGTRLMLPPWLEPDRARLHGLLPPLRLPQVHVHGR